MADGGILLGRSVVGCRTVTAGDHALPLAADGGDLGLASLSLAAYGACLAAAVRSADLISFWGVFLNGLPLGAVPSLGGPDPVTLGTFGPGVAGGVSSLSLITVTGLGGGSMVALADTLGDLPPGGL